MITLETEEPTFAKRGMNTFWTHFNGKLVFVTYITSIGCLSIEYNYYVPANTYENEDSIKITKEEFISSVKRLLIDCRVPNASYVLSSILKYNHIIKETNKIKKP